jgi:hypothetical protein
VEDEEAEVAREAGTAGWRVRTDECPERAQFVHGPTWPLREPRSAVPEGRLPMVFQGADDTFS